MISIIAAIQKKDRGLGFENKLLFRISDDLKRFKELTSGHPVIMGRKTFESIGNKPLPNRTNIVVTRNHSVAIPDVVICHSFEGALKKAKDIDENIFIIGGGEIYKEAIRLVDRLYLTIIDGDAVSDVFFPSFEEFSIINNEDHFDEKSGLHYSFVDLERN